MFVPECASWTITKIFKLGPLLQPWITYVVGNGLKTFLRLYNWHPLDPLHNKFGARVVYHLGRNLNARVG